MAVFAHIMLDSYLSNMFGFFLGGGIYIVLWTPLNKLISKYEISNVSLSSKPILSPFSMIKKNIHVTCIDLTTRQLHISLMWRPRKMHSLLNQGTPVPPDPVSHLSSYYKWEK